MMPASACGYCDRTLQLLLRTFFDIIVLRKGPENLPASSLVLLVAIGLFGLSHFVSAALVRDTQAGDVVLGLASSVLGYVLLWMILAATGHAGRFLQAVSATMGCGAILSILMTGAGTLLVSMLGQRITSAAVWAIIIWSVFVKGHIIARTIERERTVGALMALTIFVIQLGAYRVMAAGNSG